MHKTYLPQTFNFDRPPHSSMRDAFTYDLEKIQDEAVIQGLADAGSSLKHKQSALANHFDAEIALIRSLPEKVEDHEAFLKTLEQKMETLEQAYSDAGSPKRVVSRRTRQSSHLMRSLTGVALALGICVFNFFFVYEQLGGYFEHAVLVSLGVLLAGLFTLFQPLSLLFRSDLPNDEAPSPPELWKERLGEFGVPLAAALFVVVWGLEARPLLQSAASFFFLCMVFLFGGKLMLSLLTSAAVSFKHWRHERAYVKTVERLHGQADRIRQDIFEAKSFLFAHPGEEELAARREATLALVMSEFELAVATRNGHASHPEIPTLNNCFQTVR